MGGQEGDALQRRRFSSVADSRDTETVDAGLELLFFGITTLSDSKTLTGGRSNLYVVCMYQLFGNKKKKSCRAISFI